MRGSRLRSLWKVAGLFLVFFLCSAEAGSDGGAGCDCGGDDFSVSGGCGSTEEIHSQASSPSGPSLAEAKEEGRRQAQSELQAQIDQLKAELAQVRQDQPTPPPAVRKPELDPVPPAEGTPRFIKSVKVAKKKYPKWYVERTNGADMNATYDCNGWRRGTNPPVQRNQRIRICGW